jgi:hypothetical protein
MPTPSLLISIPVWAFARTVVADADRLEPAGQVRRIDAELIHLVRPEHALQQQQRTAARRKRGAAVALHGSATRMRIPRGTVSPQAG